MYSSTSTQRDVHKLAGLNLLASWLDLMEGSPLTAEEKSPEAESV